MSNKPKGKKTIYDGVPPGTNLDADMAKKLITSSKGNIIDIDGKQRDAVDNELDITTMIDKSKAEKEIKAVEKYNESLRKEVDSRFEDYVLHGNNLLVCLLKHKPYTDSGLYNAIQAKYQTEGGRVKSQEAPLQYIPQGIIVNASGTYSEGFEDRYKVGDEVVLRMGINLDQLMFFEDIPDLFTNKGGNVYSEFTGVFKINENMIEYGFKSK